jgi:hypothetical protein
MKNSSEWVNHIEQWFRADGAGDGREVHAPQDKPRRKPKPPARPQQMPIDWDAMYARILERQRYPDWFYDPQTEGNRQFRDDYLRQTGETL